jgi:membrane protein required for colicin V production
VPIPENNLSVDFNYIDAFVLIAFALAFYKGFSKGFVSVLASLVALVVGIIGAIYFSDLVAEKLHEQTEIEESYISIVAFSITFLGIMLGVHLLAKIINQAIKMVALAPLNKIMGGVASMVKTAVILSVSFYIFDFVNSKAELVKNKVLRESVSYEPLRDFTETVIPYFAKSEWYSAKNLERVIEDFKQGLEEKVDELSEN